MRTYRVENGRGQAGSRHQLKAQSATTLLRSRYFLGTAPVDRSSRAPQFAAPMKESQGISCRRVDMRRLNFWSHCYTRIAQFNESASNLATLNPHCWRLNAGCCCQFWTRHDDRSERPGPRPQGRGGVLSSEKSAQITFKSTPYPALK